jgi:hypothetical protein
VLIEVDGQYGILTAEHFINAPGGRPLESADQLFTGSQHKDCANTFSTCLDAPRLFLSG